MEGVYVPSMYEVHYKEDGTIYIPEALRPYMGGKDKIVPGGK